MSEARLNPIIYDAEKGIKEALKRAYNRGKEDALVSDEGRAGFPWHRDEEETLSTALEIFVKLRAKIHQRTEGAIQSRLNLMMRGE